MSKGGEQFWRVTLFSLFGPLLWAVHFGLVYGGQHVGCAPPVSANPIWIKAGVGVVTLIAAGPLLIAVLRPRIMAKYFDLLAKKNDTHIFLTRTMRLLSLLSLFGVLWAGAAAAFLPACPVLR